MYPLLGLFDEQLMNSAIPVPGLQAAMLPDGKKQYEILLIDDDVELVAF